MSDSKLRELQRTGQRVKLIEELLRAYGVTPQELREYLRDTPAEACVEGLCPWCRGRGGPEFEFTRSGEDLRTCCCGSCYDEHSPDRDGACWDCPWR